MRTEHSAALIQSCLTRKGDGGCMLFSLNEYVESGDWKKNLKHLFGISCLPQEDVSEERKSGIKASKVDDTSVKEMKENLPIVRRQQPCVLQQHMHLPTFLFCSPLPLCFAKFPLTPNEFEDLFTTIKYTIIECAGQAPRHFYEKVTSGSTNALFID